MDTTLPTPARLRKIKMPDSGGPLIEPKVRTEAEEPAREDHHPTATILDPDPLTAEMTAMPREAKEEESQDPSPKGEIPDLTPSQMALTADTKSAVSPPDHPEERSKMTESSEADPLDPEVPETPGDLEDL